MTDASEREPVDLLAEEFLAARRAGEAVGVGDFARAHPEHADAIRSLFPMLLAVESQVPPDPLAARATVGPYRVVREIGRGGAGVVYLAVDVRLGRRVALKVLADGPAPTPAALARFRREAEAASRVEHAGLCPLYDVGEADGRPYIAFRWIPGESLARRIRRRRERAATGEAPALDALERETVLRVVEEAARALHAAHEAGLVHRDVKPANLMVTPQGTAVVLDFGLAHPAAGDGAPATSRTGVGGGTPAYMAPEQLVLPADALDARTDVYGLGATLYEALTLHPPFEAPTLSALFDRIARVEPERPRRLEPSIPRDVEAILSVALAKDRGDRYATAFDLAQDLARRREGLPLRARPVGPVGRCLRWARRNRSTAAAVAVAFLALATALGVSLSLLADARTARAASRADALAAVSAEGGRTDGMLGLLLAREAVRAERTPRTIGRLHAALEASLERRRLPLRESPVVSLALDATGDVVLEGCEDGAFVRHDLRSGRAVALERAGASPGPARAAVLLAKGAALVVDAAGTARLFEPDGRARATLFGGAPVRTVDARSAAVGVLGFLKDGRLLAADPEAPASVRSYGVPRAGDEDPPTIESARSRPGDLGVAAALSDGSVLEFAPDGTPGRRRREATAVGRGPVALLDDDAIARCVPGGVVEIDKAPRGTFAGVWKVWGADGVPGKDLAGAFTPSPAPPWSAHGVRGIVGADGVVKTDAAARVTFDLDLRRDDRLERLVASEDGSRLLTVRARTPRDLGDESDPVTLRLWTPLGNRVGPVLLGARPATAAAFSADGRVLAVACPPEGTALCATSPAGLFGGMVAGRSARLRGLREPEITDGGRLLVFEESDLVLSAYATDGSEARVWSRPLPPPKALRFDAPEGPGPILVAAFRGGIRLFDRGGGDPFTWDEKEEIRQATWLGGKDRIVLGLGGTLVWYSDERDRFTRAVGGFTRWRRPDGTLVAERVGRLVSHPVHSIPRADRVVLQREDGSLEVDDRDGRPLATMDAPTGQRALDAEFSADGSRVLVRFHPDVFDGRRVGAARLHDAATGALLAESPLHAVSGGSNAALAPDGRSFAVTRVDDTTVVLDDAGRVRSTLLARGGSSVLSIVFDGAGRRLAVGHEDGSVDVREASGALLFSLPPREGGVSARFTPDDRRLVTWTPRGAVGLWSLDVDEALATADARVTRGFTAAEIERYGGLLAPAERSAR